MHIPGAVAVAAMTTAWGGPHYALLRLKVKADFHSPDSHEDGRGEA